MSRFVVKKQHKSIVQTVMKTILSFFLLKRSVKLPLYGLPGPV